MEAIRIILAFYILCLACFLQSCATEPEKQATLQEGKQNFLAHNYRQAYRDLLPLAKTENAAAEYAVGYMYFYGKGVSEDINLAEFWMEKAAAQGYPQAQQALVLIKDQKHSNSSTG